MRYGRDYQGDWQNTGRGRGYGSDYGYQGEWSGFDRNSFHGRGYGMRDMQRYEENYRFQQGRNGYDQGLHFGSFGRGGYDQGFRQGGFQGRGYDYGYSDRDRGHFGRGVYDQGFRPTGLGYGNTGFGPRSYGQGEINSWTIPGSNPMPGGRTNFATGYGMGRGRFL